MGRSLAIARSAIRWQLLMALAEIPQVCSAGNSGDSSEHHHCHA